MAGMAIVAFEVLYEIQDINSYSTPTLITELEQEGEMRENFSSYSNIK